LAWLMAAFFRSVPFIMAKAAAFVASNLWGLRATGPFAGPASDKGGIVEGISRVQSRLEGDDFSWAQTGHEGSPGWPGAAVRDRDRICGGSTLVTAACMPALLEHQTGLASGSGHSMQRQKEC
jgi:hypothetical protein